jgi:protein-S-isoprenylcysteine O-methyltransferase Ste14
MNVRRRKSGRRKGQVVVRTVFGLGLVTAGVLAYLLSHINPFEAVVLPAIVLGSVAFGVALYGRTRYRQEWSAAWDAYAQREVARPTTKSVEADRTFSVSSTK